MASNLLKNNSFGAQPILTDSGPPVWAAVDKRAELGWPSSRGKGWPAICKRGKRSMIYKDTGYKQGCAIVSLLSQVLVLILYLAIVLVLELKLVSQRSPGQYCYCYWYCNLHSTNIGIDIAIGKHTLLVLVLALLLQNTFSKYCHCYQSRISIFQILM